MADEMEFDRSDQSDEVKQLLRSLEGWREFTVVLHDILIWDKPFYPAIIVGLSTFLFLIIWYVDLSVLTIVSLLCMFVSVADYAVPLLSNTLFSADSWNGTKESQYEQICQELVDLKNWMKVSVNSIGARKETHPKLYFVVVVITLSIIAWIGNSISNTFLMYMIVTFILLSPGMKHHGIFEKYTARIVLKISETLGHKPKKR